MSARALVEGLPANQQALIRQVEHETALLIEPLALELLRGSSRLEVSAFVDLLGGERDVRDQYRLLERLTDSRGTHVKLISALLELHERDPRRFDRLKTAVARLDAEIESLRPLRPPFGSRMAMGLLYSASLITYTYGYFGTWADPANPASVAYWALKAKQVAWAGLLYVGLQVGGELLVLKKTWPSYRTALRNHRHSLVMLDHLKVWIQDVERDAELRSLRESLRYAASDRPVRDLVKLLPELMAEAERHTETYLREPDRLTELRAFGAQTQTLEILREFARTLSEHEKAALQAAFRHPRVKHELPWTLIPKMQSLEAELNERFERSLPASEANARARMATLARLQGDALESRSLSGHMVREAAVGNFTLTVSLAIAAVAVGVGNSALAIDGHLLQTGIDWVRAHPQSLLWAAALGTIPSFYAPLHRVYRTLAERWRAARTPLWERPEFSATEAEFEILRRHLVSQERDAIPKILGAARARAGAKSCRSVHGD
ncbi:MAG: hypothetical protein KF767_06120 [Bdellovibrionaceae bacterium]|nr:hypothetical protein [Pseudobdellovibrionaceae bacterium]